MARAVDDKSPVSDGASVVKVRDNEEGSGECSDKESRLVLVDPPEAVGVAEAVEAVGAVGAGDVVGIVVWVCPVLVLDMVFGGFSGGCERVLVASTMVLATSLMGSPVCWRFKTDNLGLWSAVSPSTSGLDKNNPREISGFVDPWLPACQCPPFSSRQALE